MIKCKEYLAFVNAKSDKVKYRFELEFDEKDLRIEGRRKQLIKKVLTYCLKNNVISGRELFGYLKKTHGITGRDMLSWAFGENPLEDDKNGD